MISADKKAEIQRLFHAEKWRIGTIARQLGIHHNTVKRALERSTVELPKTNRSSMVQPYVPFIVETLEKYPKLTASRLYDMVCERGYPGKPDHFRSVVAKYRPRKPAEAYLRLRTFPGEQAQVDWGHFGKLTIGQALRPLVCFVMVLSWSRMVFLRFYLNARMPNFIRGHVEAFNHFGCLARVILYDNLKSAVVERIGDAIRFHPTLLELSGHYRFQPKPVAVARGNEKGRVDNDQAYQWSMTTAAQRPWPQDNSKTVQQAFAEEKSQLLQLPDTAFETTEREEVHIGKTPYARFDLNDYSVPPTYVKRTLVVVADLKTVRIVDKSDVIATHPRSFDKKQQIEDPEHIAELVEHKNKAKSHRLLDRLHSALPSCQLLLNHVALRGGNLGSMTWSLRRLLDLHGADALEHAIVEALNRGTPHLGALRQILEQQRKSLGLPPKVPVQLPDDPRFNQLNVRPHNLKDYDQLTDNNHEQSAQLMDNDHDEPENQS
jgi:transposase